MINNRRTTRALERLVYSYERFISDIYNISGHYPAKVDKNRASHYGKSEISHYGFVPSSIEMVISTLLSVYDHIKKVDRTKDSKDRSVRFVEREIRFLDIGCGIGNVVRTAQILGFNAEGLEYNKKIYEVAVRFLGYSKAIKKGNMLTFKNYHKYDVLYYYQPINDSQVMRDFAKKLAKGMKVGAYVIPHGANPFGDMKSFKKIPSSGYYVYKKIKEV